MINSFKYWILRKIQLSKKKTSKLVKFSFKKQITCILQFNTN